MKPAIGRSAVVSRPPILLLSFVLALTAIVYLPSLGYGFTNWDDDKYVVNNPAVRSVSLQAIAGHFTAVLEGNYHPLTMLSLSLDYAIGQLNPVVYHTTNLSLHLLNTALVFWLCLLLMGPRPPSPVSVDTRTAAGVVALLFGVHTSHVESVVWIAERKDLLYAAFFLSSLICYVKYLTHHRTKYFVWALGLFVAALLSKAMAVSFAVTLFAIDYLFQRRLSKGVILEKLPFVGLAIAFGVIAVVTQRGQGAMVPETYLSLPQRVLVACYGLVHHVSKLILPVDLSPFYPYPRRVEGRLPLAFMVSPLPVAVLFGAVALTRRYGRVVVFGSLFFLINVALVLQLFPVGSAVMADRYVYVSSVGFFILAGTAYGRLARREQHRLIANAVVLVYVVFLGISTFRYATTWKDSVTLWNAVIEKDPPSPLPYYNRGSALSELGSYPAAIRDLSRAIELNPRYAEAYHNRGAAKKALQDYDGAMADFKQALSINPDYKDAHLNAGNLMVTLGDFPGAIGEYTSLIALGGDAKTVTDAHLKRGIARYLAAEYRGAIDDLVKAGESDPSRVRDVFPGLADVDVRTNRGACRDWTAAAATGADAAKEYVDRYCR